MAELQDLLASFTRLRGVSAAALVGQDGLVLHSEIAPRDNGIDVEALGALASSGLIPAQELGSETGAGKLRQSILEFEGGVVVIEPVGEQALLVVVTDAAANLGLLRLTARRLHPDIESALEGI